MKIIESDIKRFYDKVSFGLGFNACWAWLGGLNMKTGRGTFWIDEDTRCASRTAYEIYFGEFDNNLFVCHHCDNPNCVNPSHLFLGSNSDNQKDMYAKGLRCVRGENAPNSKLTNKDVIRIRELWSFTIMNQKQIAEIYNVDPSNISHIVNNKTFVSLA